MRGMDALFIIAFVGWLMGATSWVFFRKPGISLFQPCWRPWSPQDYVSPIGVFLWAVGGGTFVVCWVACFFLIAA
jgi:hypothetical protein